MNCLPPWGGCLSHYPGCSEGQWSLISQPSSSCMESLPCKLAGVREIRAPVLPRFWTWNRVSFLWVVTEMKKEIQLLDHTHQKFSLFNSDLEEMRKAGDLHILKRYISLHWESRAEGAPSSWSHLPKVELPSNWARGEKWESRSWQKCHRLLLLLLNSIDFFFK